MNAIYDQNYHISMKKIIFRKIAQDCFKFFFLTIFTISTIIWVLQAVNYLDFVVEDGHGLLVYFKYTLLNFPKIISRIFPFALFISITYILIKYENNNELVIFWNIGINKNRFINFFIKISFLFVLLNILLSSIIAPLSQSKARSFLKNSDLNFFESALKPKKFNDIVTNLTIYFEEKDDNGGLKNIFLKEDISENSYQITYGKTGVSKLYADKKLLILFNGKSIINKQGKISEFKFTDIDIDISRFSSRTVTTPKNQETSTQNLILCLSVLSNEKIGNKTLISSSSIINCSRGNVERIFKELYGRLIKPFYNIILVMIALLLILKSKDSYDFKFYKFKLYTFGFFFIFFIESSSKLISTNNLYNSLIFGLPVFLFSLIYFYFWTNLKITEK